MDTSDRSRPMNGAFAWAARYASPGQPHTEAVRLDLTPTGRWSVPGGNAGGTDIPLDGAHHGLPAEGPTVP